MSRRRAGLGIAVAGAALLLLLLLTGGAAWWTVGHGGPDGLAGQLAAGAGGVSEPAGGAVSGAGATSGRSGGPGPGADGAIGGAAGAADAAAAAGGTTAGTGADEGLLAEDGSGRPGRGALRLRVVDGEGMPIAGAGVSVAGDPADRISDEDAADYRLLRGTTGADGVARLLVEFPDPWDDEELTVHVRAARFAPRLVPDVRVRAGSERDLGDVRLAPGRRVDGRVVDAGGLTVAGAAVWARRRGPGRWLDLALGPPTDAVRSGPDGAFRLADLPPGPLVLRAIGDGHGPGVLALAGDPPGPCEIRLVPGVALRGRVVRAQGVLPLMRVWVSGGGADAPPLRVLAAPDGTFAIPGVPLGTAYLSARSADSLVSGNTAIVVKPFMGPVEVRVQDAEPGDGSVIAATVTDAGTGAPIRRFRVTWISETPGAGDADPDFETSWDDFTADDGRFRLEDLSPAAYAIRVRARGYAEGRLNLTLDAGASRTDLGVALHRDGLTITGVVRRRADRAPVAGVRVVPFRLIGPGDWDWTEDDELHSAALTGADGTFQLLRLGPGPLWLRIEGGEADLGATTVALPDPAKGPVEVLLDAAATLTGSVRDAAGTPVVGREVVAMASADADSLQLDARTDDDGRFTIRGLRPGAWQVGPLPEALSAGRKPIVPQTVALTAGERRELVLTLPPPSVIAGVVRWGAPAPGHAVVGIYAVEGNFTDTAALLPDGTFRSRDLLPGVYRVVVRLGNGFPSPPRSVTVGPGETARVELAPPPIGRATLTVTTADGRPVPGRLTLGLTRSGPAGPGLGDQAWAWVGDGGIAVMVGILPGEYRVDVYAPGKMLRGNFALDPGQETCAVTVQPVEAGSGGG